MTNEQQVVAGPLAVFVKPYAGGVPAMPVINRSAADLVGADGYQLLGRRGADSVKRDGVMLVSTQENTSHTGAAGTKPTDRWRTKDEASLRFSLVDLQLETLAVLLDQTVVSTVHGAQPDHKEIGIGRPLELKRWSVLARGRSPYANEGDKLRQYLLFCATVTSNYEETNALDNPTDVQFEFSALALTDAALAEHERFGKLRAWSGA